jgi:glycosyltransferase involved in cell wall biosynthesis
MAAECRRAEVTAVHAYEDCSLQQFIQAKRLGKACIYDMPIGYYGAWEETEKKLIKKYSEWLPFGGAKHSPYVRREQKKREMELADLVLVPSSFAEETVKRFFPEKAIARAPYGVDLDFWHPPIRKKGVEHIRFLYTGQISLRKGVPVLLEAWEAAGLHDASLELVGSWQLAPERRMSLPRGVAWSPPCSAADLRQHYWGADVFVLPSFFEGFPLALLEAMACGLPAIASDATSGRDLNLEEWGRTVPAGELSALTEALRWFSNQRGSIATFGEVALRQSSKCRWEAYRKKVAASVADVI